MLGMFSSVLPHWNIGLNSSLWVAQQRHILLKSSIELISIWFIAFAFNLVNDFVFFPNKLLSQRLWCPKILFVYYMHSDSRKSVWFSLFVLFILFLLSVDTECVRYAWMMFKIWEVKYRIWSRKSFDYKTLHSTRPRLEKFKSIRVLGVDMQMTLEE